MNEREHESAARRACRLPAGGAGAGRGGGAGAAPGRLRGVPRRARVAAAGGADAARVGGESRAAAASCGRGSWAKSRPMSGQKRSRARRGRRMRGFSLRPAVGLAVLALLVAGVAGYAIRDSGWRARRDHGRRRPRTRGDGEDGPRGRLRDAATRQRPPAALQTRSCRRGCGAASGSNRRRRCSSPTATAPRPR